MRYEQSGGMATGVTISHMGRHRIWRCSLHEGMRATHLVLGMSMAPAPSVRRLALYWAVCW